MADEEFMPVENPDAPIGNYRTKKAHMPVEFLDDKPAKPDRRHALDSDKNKKLLSRLQAWRDYERVRQSVNRYQMAIDEDFYDHLQWTPDDAEVLRERGQAPLVFNLCRPAIDWLIGTERRTRIDFKILPRKEADEEITEVKTEIVKYLSDVNKAPFCESRAFGDQVKCGLGWVEDGINPANDGELLFTKHESWRSVLYDSHSKELDLSDARYLFRWKWVDLDIALSMFPERAAKIRKAAVNASSTIHEDDDDVWYLGQRLNSEFEVPLDRRTYVSEFGNVAENNRQRVKLTECQYRAPVSVKRFSDGEYEGEVFDQSRVEHVMSVEAGSRLYDFYYLQMYIAIFTDSDLLQNAKCPYRHNDFTLTPVWGYRRGRDRAPYGYIRGLRDPQEDYNKRRSKALWMLSANRIISDADAFDDVDEAREEAARPDAFFTPKKGSRFEIAPNDDIQGQLVLMQSDMAMIQGGGGGGIGPVNQDNLGAQSNATSGRAILARQEQGSTGSTELFDNFRLAKQISGQKRLSLIEQYYTEEKTVRVVGQKGKIGWKKVNEYDGANNEYMNDITQNASDYVISEQDWRASVRQSMFETMTDMVARMQPDLAIQFLDLVFDLSDLPNKEELVSRIRKINGHVDPNAEVSPEEQKVLDQEKQAKQEQAELQRAQIMKTLEKLDADVALTRSKADQASADAVVKVIGTLGKSLTGAAALAQNPSLAALGDAMLKSIGFVDKDQPPVIPEPVQQEQQSAVQPEAQPQLPLEQ